ncbi:MAG: PAS domain S-box protein, partial [Desulfovibrionaceae bacterium]|nr:PAS domain S-box protein [Desulfovibrionaceae bacterium]
LPDVLAEVYEDLPVGLALFRLGGGLLYANKAFCSIVAGAGVNPARLRFPEASALFRLDAPAARVAPVRPLLPVSPASRDEDGDGAEDVNAKFQGVEKYLERTDGSFSWCRTHLSRTSLPGGEPCLRLVVDDVTRYRERVEQLVNRHKLYRGFVELRSDPLCRFLPDLSLLYANASFCKCFGRTRREVVGRNFLDLIRPEDRVRLVSALDAVTPSAPAAHMEQRLAWPDGGTLWIKWTFRGFFYRTGHIKDYQGVGVDISEHKIAEERVFQAGRLVSLGTLVSGVAHEVNNPNNFIMLNAPLLAAIWDKALPVLRRAAGGADGPDGLGGASLEQMDADVRGLLGGIAEGAARIKNIVGELKQYARLADGGSLTLVAVDEIVASAVLLLGKTIRTHTNHLSVRRGENLPMVKGVAQRLEQVILNLIQNACLALENPSQAIEIVTDHDRSSDSVRITVRDEGVGIRPEDMPRVAEPFFSTRARKGGTGLGLPISLKILKDHGGRLEFDSTPGQGTRARIVLPAAR